MISFDVNNDALLKPGKTVVSVAMIKKYESGTPVFVQCYRKSNNWTLPFAEMDYTNTTNPIDLMMTTIQDLALDDFDVMSAEPIVDCINEDKPSRLLMYLVNAGEQINAYQIYTTPEDDVFRLSRFMHQNQLFCVLKGALLLLYIDYLRSK